MADNTSSWINFAQLPVDQGGLGLQPHQAAGLVGNLVNESGSSLPSWGPTGDNGSAWGTAQWRGDRLAALKSAYPDSYQTPQSQQAFMRSEFLGPENGAYKALLAAQTPEDAAAAVNHLYERSADNSGNREAAARKLMQSFGAPGGTGGALSLADEDAGDSDTSSTGALSANNTIGAGALTPQRVMKGDDGSDNKLGTIGAGLAGIGASLASISSPQQAYALNQQAQAIKKDNQSKYKISVTKDGKIVRVDDSGNVDVVGGTPGTTPNAPIPQIGDYSKSGEDYLNSMPETDRNFVMGLVDGTLPLSQYKMNDPRIQAYIAAAKHVDGSFDASSYAARAAGRKDWATGGKSADIVKSLNQAMGHLSELPASYDVLDNGQSPAWNAAGNYINNEVLGKKGVSGFITNAHAVADELGKLFKGGNLSDREIKQWEASLDPNASPEQMRDSMSKLSTLTKHAMSALEDKRRMAIGPVASQRLGPLLSSDGQAALDKIDTWAKGPATTATPTSINNDAIDAELKRRNLM